MDDGWERAKSYLGTGFQGPPSLHHPHPPIPPATPFLAVKWSSSPQGGLTYYYYYVLPLAKLLRTSSIQILLFFFFVSLSFFFCFPSSFFERVAIPPTTVTKRQVALRLQSQYIRDLELD